MKTASTTPPKNPATVPMVRADQKWKHDADDGNLQVDARAPDDPGEDIAAKIVGAEGMRKRRRDHTHLRILQDRIVGRDQWRGERNQQEHHKDAGTNGKRHVTAEKPAPRNSHADHWWPPSS
jgi:hypothetical protein